MSEKIYWTKDGHIWQPRMTLYQPNHDEVITKSNVPCTSAAQFYAKEQEAWREVARTMEEKLNNLFDKYLKVMDKVICSSA